MADFDRMEIDEWNADRGRTEMDEWSTDRGRTEMDEWNTNRGRMEMDEWNIDRDLPRRRPERRQDPRMAEVRRKRKKRQRTRRIILFIILIILVLGAVGAGTYFLINNLPSRGTGSNTYVRNVDVTDMVAGDMAVWLSDIEGENIDTEWVKSRCDGFWVKTKLNLDKDAQGNNIFSEVIDESSYIALGSSIDDALNNLLAEVIANRLVSGGYADSVSKEEAAGIALQILGMSMSDYIKENGVNILPTIDSLNETMTMGSGSYNITKGIITCNLSSGETLSETVIEKNNSIVFVDSSRVYVKEENSNE